MCTYVGRVCHVKKKELRVKKEEEEEKKARQIRCLTFALVQKKTRENSAEGHFKNNTR